MEHMVRFLRTSTLAWETTTHLASPKTIVKFLRDSMMSQLQVSQTTSAISDLLKAGRIQRMNIYATQQQDQDPEPLVCSGNM